jgi:signal transduction histidine kinase
MVAGLRLNVLVCSASRPDMGVVAVMDETGGELLELGPRGVPILAGDVIHIEGRSCLLRRRETGVEITKTPLLDDDGTHGLRLATTKVRLKAGLHVFQLDYFNYLAAYGLELSCQLPNGTVEPADHFLVRPSGRVGNETNMIAGLKAIYYEGGWLNLPDYTLLKPVKTVTATNLNPIVGPQTELFGIQFKGFFSAPVDGNYTFNLASDDGSLLFLDDPYVSLTSIGHVAAPSPIATTLRASVADAKAPKWISVEGRVVFVSRSGRGFCFELQSQPDSIWVTVADGKEFDLMHLLNSRIRVSGIGRAEMAMNQERRLGSLSVATADDIKIQDNSAGTLAAGVAAPTLITIENIQGLSKDEATRHWPVRIRGVVTSIAPSLYHYMSVQDESRGIFVRLSPSVKAPIVEGQFCEIVGHTDTGDFAPIVVAQDVTVLGKGRMPPPVRPTWNQLINGSMDIQWVEIQGLVTAVHSNNLALLLPEGEIDVEVGAYSESQLRVFQDAVIRLRGVLFAAWNTNRTVQVGHLFMRNVMIGVDVAPPRDPFDVPVKTWSELYQFDSTATPFQRVKVRGTVIYADARRVFLMDQVRGIDVLTVEPTNVRFGDEVDVVGYPDISGSAPLLREAILRRTGQTVEPTPLVVDGSQLAQGKIESMLVRVSATLMGLHSEPDSRVLEMNAGGHLFLARLQETTESAPLRIGSKLALTGVYVGKVTAWSEGGKPSGFELLLSSPSQVVVLSQPSWWTPRRLLVMVGLLLATLALSMVWISLLQRRVEQRTRQLQHETREREVAERERALETERSRIARDLHDDLGSSLTEISVLATTGLRSVALPEFLHTFRAIAAKARELVTALDVIVWAVDPKDNSLESVADYLGDFVSEYLSHSGIICRFDIPVALPSIVLEGRLRYGLLLAVKETLNNVERHARATEVEFRMICAEGHLHIIIADNGKGFDTQKRHGGNGLKNLPLRLAKLGGRYNVESSIEKGTVVTIGLCLSQHAKSAPPKEPGS